MLDSESVEKIASLLQASDVRSRRQAIVALEKSNHPEAVKHLNWAVRNETDEELRQLASQAVRTIRQRRSDGVDSSPDLQNSVDNIPSSFPDSTPVQVSNPNIKKVNNRQTTQDSILLAICLLLLGGSFMMALSSASLIQISRVPLADGEIFGRYVEEVREIFLSYEYPDPENALKQINQFDGNLNMGDITRFYNGHNSIGRIIFKPDVLWWTYINNYYQFPVWLQAEYKGDDTNNHNLMMYFMMVNSGLTFVAVSLLIGLSNDIRVFLFRFLRMILTALGMRVFWTLFFVACLAGLVMLGLIYTQGIQQFIYDLMATMELKTTHVNLRQVVGWQFGVIFALWSITATIALASILFRPYEKLETDQP